MRVVRRLNPADARPGDVSKEDRHRVVGSPAWPIHDLLEHRRDIRSGDLGALGRPGRRAYLVLQVAEQVVDLGLGERLVREQPLPAPRLARRSSDV